MELSNSFTKTKKNQRSCLENIIRRRQLFAYCHVPNCKWVKSSVIMQKGESQNECFKKAKHAKISEKKTFLTSDTHTYVCVSGGKKCLFFGNFDMLCFLETPVLRFALLPY